VAKAKQRSVQWGRVVRIGWPIAVIVLCAAAVVYGVTRPVPPERSDAIRARLELAAGAVTVDQGDGPQGAVSGMALRAGATVEAGKGARALVRLPDGSTSFLRGGTKIALAATKVTLEAGECWLNVPAVDRDALVHHLGDVSVSAVDAGLSLKRTEAGAVVYVARGMAIVTGPGGRVEVNAGEQAVVEGSTAPKITPVAFWDDWTGGMADFDASVAAIGEGSGTIYGVDLGASAGSPARPLQIKQQSVRAVLRQGLGETEVDQTFFNPSPRPVEGWYWFVIPEGASVTGFAVETNGVLIEGEFIEKREAATKYAQAKSSGHAPAILEWVDGRSYRARIFPVPASGIRRVVLRYIEQRPLVDNKLTYVYPMGRGTPARIGEFSLAVDLGSEGRKMTIATLDDARVEDGGRRVTMRRSGYTPRVDFQLEATQQEGRAPLSVARFATEGEGADYIMARYTPDVDWTKVKQPQADIVVVVDTSAAGDEAARQLKAATAEAILRSLSVEDKFALVSLDVVATVLHPEKGLAAAGDEQIAKALEKLADHSSGGATDMAALFDAALGRVHGAEQPAVVYVGDGRATSGEMTGEQLIERLRRALSTSRARLFTVAVGATANLPLLGELAHAGGGRSFEVTAAGQATAEALELAAAVKVPTITDFELDLGAGLDEPFINVNGKVPRGSDVMVLARTHHDIPDQVKVRGRLGGEPFEKDVKVVKEKGVVRAFVPRLWASAYVRRLLGAAAGPETERARIVALGTEYGLVTPFTSILALESESAYRDMGIERRRSPLRGVRLGALDTRAERRLETTLDAYAVPQVAFGCQDRMMAGDADEAPDEDARDQVPAAAPVMAAPTAVAQAEQSPAGAPRRNGRAAAAKARVRAQLNEADKKMKRAEGRFDDSEGEPKTAGIKRPRPAEAAPATVPAVPRKGRGPGKDQGGQFEVDGFGGGSGRVVKRNKKPPKPVVVLRTCSDVARRPLAQRQLFWRKRLRTARSASDLLARYRSAQQACELGDWRAEREFLSLMQKQIASEGGAKLVLESFAGRPDVQKYVAKLILRRVVDPRIVSTVERVLFGTGVDWNQLELKLTEMDDPEERITKLREAMAQAPGDPNGQIRLVELLAEAGHTGEALALGRRLRDQGLLTVGITRQLGDVLARADLDSEAVRTYSEIVEFDPHNLQSRVLLGDIYLGHGWYEPAYRQYKTAADASPNSAVAWLRLAGAAAGSGRIDEALRLERKVASAQGRPGPTDPRRWARLWSAARIARLMAEPPKSKPPSKASLERKLKELGLFNTGPGTLVLVTWEELRSDLLLVTSLDDQPTALGEAIDAAATGLSAVQLSPADYGRAQLTVRLRSLPRRDPITVVVHLITWDGKKYEIKLERHTLEPRSTELSL